MALAAKIPYDHPYAGGFPGIGSQPLPTDSDCLTYLAAVAAADGAGVEVGVATALNTFFKGLKADGLFDAIKASCILCGARTLAGALVPMAGSAPTNNNFIGDDYNRLAGLSGGGLTKYLNSNRANDDDPQDDNHNAVWVSTAHSGGATGIYMDAGGTSTGANNFGESSTAGNLFSRNRTSVSTLTAATLPTGLIGISRSTSTEYILRADGSNNPIYEDSQEPDSGDVFVFAREGGSSVSNGRIAFYSIGESLDIAALDDAVSALVTAIGAAI